MGNSHSAWLAVDDAVSSAVVAVMAVAIVPATTVFSSMILELPFLFFEILTKHITVKASAVKVFSVFLPS